MKYVLNFLLFILPFCSGLALAQSDTIVFSGTFNQLDFPLSKGVSLPDPTGQLTFSEVLKQYHAGSFVSDSTITNKYPCYWFVFSIKNAKEFVSEWQLGVGPGNEYEAYIYEENQTQAYKNGTKVPIKQRSDQLDAFHIFFQLATGKTALIFIKIGTKELSDKADIYPMLHVHDGLQVKQSRANQGIEVGFLQGVLLIMALYNLFLFLFIKDKSYLYYVCTLFGFNAYFLGLDGYADYLTGVSGLNKSFMSYAIVAICISFLQFTRHYYKSWEVYPKIDKIFKILTIYFVVNLVFVVLDYHFAIRFFDYASINNLIIVFVSLFALYFGIYSYIKKHNVAKYYLIANALFFSFAIIFILQPGVLNVLPPSYFGSLSLRIGIVLQLVMFSVALAARINILKDEVSRQAVEKQLAEKEQIAKIQQLTIQKNEELEQKVVERTEQLAQANSDLNQTIEELDTTNESLKLLNDQLEKNNQNITASITYASRIQQAILPLEEKLKKLLGNYFIFFQPKDLVAGDFYWIEQKEDKVFVACCDCTGHGVPGAFMSLIGNELLNRIIHTEGCTDASLILERLHLGIRHVLKQDETQNRDGMEVSLVVWDKNNQSVSIASAHQSVYVFENQELIEIKGDKFSIGGLQLEVERKFSVHQLALKSGIRYGFYLSSDGFQDQFGGSEGRKFMRSTFKRLLSSVRSNTFEQQKQLVAQSFQDWRGKHKQTDDVLVIGFEIVV